MQRIVYLERESVIAEVRRPAFAHEWTEYAKTAPGQVVERLAGATIAIINKAPLAGCCGQRATRAENGGDCRDRHQYRRS
jgi:hypothetical protein